MAACVSVRPDRHLCGPDSRKPLEGSGMSKRNVRGWANGNGRNMTTGMRLAIMKTRKQNKEKRGKSDSCFGDTAVVQNALL